MFQISLASARVNANMTQGEAANTMHVSRTTIVNWEKGKVMPGISQLSMLCEIYHVPKDHIFLPSKSTKSRKKKNHNKIQCLKGLDSIFHA